MVEPIQNNIEKTFNVNVLIKKEDDLFVAHCLEFDIVAVAKTQKQAEEDLQDLVIAQIESAFADNDIKSLFHPAPQRFWEEYFECNKQDKGEAQTGKNSTFQPGLVMKTFVPRNLSYA